MKSLAFSEIPKKASDGIENWQFLILSIVSSSSTPAKGDNPLRLKIKKNKSKH